MSNESPESVAVTRAAAKATSSEGAGTGSDAQPLMLCVDTATEVRSVALACGRHVFARQREASTRGQSSALLEEIDTLLRGAQISLREIELYTVVTGPGSFTGLRAGLATIKAFAATQARPIAPVPTLHAVALSAGASARTVAMIPAGRGEIFAQTLSVEEDGRIVERTAAAHVSPELLLSKSTRLSGLVKFAGGGAQAHVELLRQVAGAENIEVIEENLISGDAPQKGSGERRAWVLAPRAEDYAVEIAGLGLIRYLSGTLIGAHDLAASYVRPSDAELNEPCRR